MSYFVIGAADTEVFLDPDEQAAKRAQEAEVLLTRIHTEFPRLSVYPKAEFDQARLEAVALAGKLTEAMIAARKDVNNAFVGDRIMHFANQLLRAMEKFSVKYRLLSTEAHRAGKAEVVAPDFKSDLIALLISVKNSGEGIALLESMKPWWISMWGSGLVMEALLAIFRLGAAIREVYEKAKGAIKEGAKVGTLILFVLGGVVLYTALNKR